MDFEGQKQAELLMYRMLMLFSVGGFLAGYAVGSFKLMVYINAAGVALTLRWQLVCCAKPSYG